jgi:DNA repair protein RecN (Recombination protein N)
MFDANARGKFEPLQKVASGGELSRLMLCIKSLVAGKMEMPTLIFDEIDTGISGEAAKQVGNIMKDLSKKHQLIVISHQPQVAAMADVHMNVFKEQDAGVMQTKIATLNIEQRIQHIAQMIGGIEPTSAALENAKELVLR